MERYMGPGMTKCPKCHQLGFQLDYHAPGIRGCRTPMFCRDGLEHVSWEEDLEHILMTCETCGFRVRMEMDYFENSTGTTS